jgi:Glycosyl transferases group 1/Methyltransferase domain
MNRLWKALIRPILEEINAKYIVEIGSDLGVNTKNILKYCVDNDAHLTAIDPFPKFDVEEFKAEYGDKFEIYTELSLNRLPLIKDYDAILIDGDHNWYTVYNELKIIEGYFKDKKFPIIFLHDMGWPYARRDLYYNPDNIPSQHRQPYKKLGIYPDQNSLIENGGLNSHLNNALTENDPHNGILTALEDFIKESDLEFSFEHINAFHGLGILYVKDDVTDKIVKKTIESADIVGLLDKERNEQIITNNESRIKNTELKRNLKKSTTTLGLLKDELDQTENKLDQTENILKITGNRLNMVETDLNEKESQLESINQQIKIIESNEILVRKLRKKLDIIETNYLEMRYHKNYDRSFTQRLSSKFTILYLLLKGKGGIKNKLTNIKGYRSIKKNNLFDVGYYLKNNKDVMLTGKDPFLHYLYQGFKENRNPNPQFSSNYYLINYPDVKKSNLNPLIHYSLYGIEDGRKTKIKIAIKIPVPNWKTANEWGDYHFALSLQKEFEKKGCEVIIQILNEWYNGDDEDCDVVLVLRGIQKYRPNSHHFNIMWNISHPDEIDIDEYNQYDYVLIASEIWAEKIKKLADVPVGTMLQCCDPELFYPESSKDYEHEILFVGNSRKVFRKIIKDLIPTDKSLSVYGTNWDDLIDEKYIMGDHVPNKELRKAYSSCEILLNDHWEDMREKGFISNRLFDGFASGALIISDKVEGAEAVFGEALITYDTREELKDLIDLYLNDKKLSRKKVESTRKNVIENHTFQNRAEYVLDIINSNL